LALVELLPFDIVGLNQYHEKLLTESTNTAINQFSEKINLKRPLIEMVRMIPFCAIF
jgi:hypothetical protein